jgi:hypothetical protein
MKGLRIEMRVATTVYLGGDVDPNGTAPDASRPPEAAELFRLVRSQEWQAIDGIPPGEIIGSIIEVMLAEASQTAAECISNHKAFAAHT